MIFFIFYFHSHFTISTSVSLSANTSIPSAPNSGKIFEENKEDIEHILKSYDEKTKNDKISGNIVNQVNFDILRGREEVDKKIFFTDFIHIQNKKYEFLSAKLEYVRINKKEKLSDTLDEIINILEEDVRVKQERGKASLWIALIESKEYLEKLSSPLTKKINSILLFITSLLKFLDISYFPLQLPSELKCLFLHN